MSVVLRSSAHREASATEPFGGALRGWRRHRGWSQLALSLEAGVSPRHISFLETGRSAPSPTMVHRLAEALDIPLRERNRLFFTAGYASPYPESRLDQASLSQVRRAVRLLLDRHDPYPAYAIDGAWNVVATNRAHRRLTERLLPDAGEAGGNVLRLLFDPRLLRPAIVNWEACARALLARVRRQLDAPAISHEGRLAAIVEEIRAQPGVEELWHAPLGAPSSGVILPVELRVDGRTWRWLTTLVTFAGALDVTVAELTVECFFPADRQTERLAAEVTAVDDPVGP